jgi:hypothetical protein
VTHAQPSRATLYLTLEWWSMPRRLLSLFLALLTLWSALATQEQVPGLSADIAGTPIFNASASDQNHRFNGSVDDHHLDDQPTQTHLEGAFDLYGLLPLVCEIPFHSLTTSAPCPQAAQQLPHPYLGTPQRPPQVLALMA